MKGIDQEAKKLRDGIKRTYPAIYLQGLLEKIAFGICLRSSSVMYLGKAHLGKTVEGPEKSRATFSRCKKNMAKTSRRIVYKDLFYSPTSSGPGIKRNLLCSISLWWLAIICPSFPNCTLQRWLSIDFQVHLSNQKNEEQFNHITQSWYRTWDLKKSWKTSYRDGSRNFPWKQKEKEPHLHSHNHWGWSPNFS